MDKNLDEYLNWEWLHHMLDLIASFEIKQILFAPHSINAPMFVNENCSQHRFSCLKLCSCFKSLYRCNYNLLHGSQLGKTRRPPVEF